MRGREVQLCSWLLTKTKMDSAPLSRFSIHVIGGHTAELCPLEREAPLARDDSPIVLPLRILEDITADRIWRAEEV